MSKNSFEDVVKATLMETTAQDIFNYLVEIKNQSGIYEKRWIWELLQNALDAALQGQKIEVEIIKNDNQLTFRHNGRRFEHREIAHLICHGSTKKEQDIGKFGVGFLITHLLSRKVKIKGVNKDNETFEFVLNREGESFDEIKRHMKETLEEYVNSLRLIKGDASYTAEYSYPLTSTSLNAVVTGIKELTKISPYVLAFNDELGIIKITDQTRKLKFELVSETNEAAYIKKVVKEEEEGKPPILHELWVVKDDDVEIAIKGKKQDDGTYQIESLEDIPKIFIAFPLFGTQNLPFPTVVNSRKFKPRKERDGIFLGEEDTDDIKQNKGLLERANELFINFVSNPDSNTWENIHTLLKLGEPPEKDWLDKNWYIELLKKLIDGIFKLKVLKTQSGDFKILTKSFIPMVDDGEKEKIERLWELCNCFSEYKDRIPAKELAIEWANIIKKWETLGLNLIERKITIEKIASEIEACKNLQDFKTKLKVSTDEFTPLNDFYKLLLDMGKIGLLDNILPNQNGNFKEKSKLYKDEGIDETLKDISCKLGIDVRGELLHLRVSENLQLSPKKQEDVLSQIINKIKQSRPEDTQYIQTNIDLFNWLLQHDKFESLDGYPLLSSKEKTFVYLGKDRKDKPLAPQNVWNEKARDYADLFPPDFIISSDYFEKISQKDKWKKLKEFVLTDPLHNETEKINGENLVLLSGEILEENREHEARDPVELSKIAFLEVKDKNIIDTVRKSKDKAQKFLRFLFDYVIENDNYWINSMEVGCICGSQHKIYASSWLGTLKDLAWVPLRKDKSEKPNAQILASLVKTDEKLPAKCRQDKSLILLKRLDISVSEFMMNVVAKDENVRLELDNAVGSLFSTFMENPEQLTQLAKLDPNQLTKIAKLAESEPELFIKEMDDRIQTREQIRRNQSIGSSVETLLKNVLEQEGFKVKRTGWGSDFAVEHDFVKDNEEQILKIEKEEKICFYLEVKGTNQEYVRMTFPQAKEARDKSNKYVLCVVKYDGLEITEENVKNNARFIIDIGQMIRDKVSEAENLTKNLKDEQEKIAGSGDIEIEISEGPIRFKIHKKIWEKGKAFEQFLESIQGAEK